MIIYKTTNIINNKSYIGRDKNNNPKYLGSGKILKHAIKKYGKDSFIKEILEETLDKNRETFWIKYYNTISPNGYNITSGSDGGDTFTHKPEIEKQKTRKLLSIAAKQQIINNTGICSKSKSGQHITESLPQIKDVWEINYRNSMKEFGKRRRLHNLTPAEIDGLEKLRKFWNSEEERESRSNRQLGTNNSRYNGPYYLYDSNNNIVNKFNLISEIVTYTQSINHILYASYISLHLSRGKMLPGYWKLYKITRELIK